MKKFDATFIRGVALALLASVTVFLWYAVFAVSAESAKVSVSLFDVGQGDAIFIEAPGGAQMLVDGGPDRSVLAALGSVMPTYDHSIDVLVVTNPDKDHIAGLIDVLRAYDVAYVIEPGTTNPSAIYKELEIAIEKSGARRIVARRGMTVDLRGGAEFRVLFPDRDVSLWSTNDGSLVGKLSYGETSFLLTGDATARTEAILASLDGAALASDVLKVGHHGSRGSSSSIFLKYVSPEYALISAGRTNTYGHPHPETLERLTAVGALVLGTYEMGTVTLVSDGIRISVPK